MKETTKDWLTFAEDDLIAAKTLSNDDRLTSLVSFHCQQCLEKCFKAVIEEQDKSFVKSHDLLRLQLFAEIQLSDLETKLLSMIRAIWDFFLMVNLQFLRHMNLFNSVIQSSTEFGKPFNPDNYSYCLQPIAYCLFLKFTLE